MISFLISVADSPKKKRIKHNNQNEIKELYKKKKKKLLISIRSFSHRAIKSFSYMGGQADMVVNFILIEIT